MLNFDHSPPIPRSTNASEEADAEFTTELAKMVTDTSSESRKVDKNTSVGDVREHGFAAGCHVEVEEECGSGRRGG
jgi:hypothetical protein